MMKFSSSAGPHRTCLAAVLGERTFCNAAIAGEALAELGAEQQKGAIATRLERRRQDVAACVATKSNKVGKTL